LSDRQIKVDEILICGGELLPLDLWTVEVNVALSERCPVPEYLFLFLFSK